MHPTDISDSFAGIGVAPAGCPRCGAKLSVSGGDCLRCMLETGLQPEEAEEEGEESLEELLAEVDVRDTDWRLGNYHILEEIGRGGMGVIYRARQRHSKRIVALKRVLGYHSDSRETLERFRREAEAAASLDHPNILPIYEVGEADGLPFFTMKLATGGSLQRVATAVSSDPRQCVRLLAKVARAIAYAHRQGILHRDLKPGNILLDGRGEPMVSDFGLAKWMEANTDLTRSLAIFGTPGFIAPEQAAGPAAALTPSAEIYSLGAILFDLLSGRPPFLGDHAISVIRQASENPAPRLRSINGSLDRDLETICAKCLEREPQARYRSAADLAEDLERWLEGRSIVARPVRAPLQLWRWSKRNPVVALTAAASIAVSAVAVTRQLDSWRLQAAARTQAAAQHSVKLIPLLDLDTGKLSEEWTKELAAELRHMLHAIGPAEVTMAGNPLPAASPPANLTEDAPARAALSGTIRTLNGRRRVSIHLLDANTQAPLLHRIAEVDMRDAAASVARELAPEAYKLLSAADLKSAAKRTSDPGLLDPEAKSFIDQGIELANRRGGLDLDRSVACLRHALELQPGSAAAHAALARAFIHKASYQSSREPLQAALEHGRKAVALDPANPDASLQLAAALIHHGHFKESIEHTLISLEHSPGSRRAAALFYNTYKVIGRPDKAWVWLEIAAPGQDRASRAAGFGDLATLLCEDERAKTLYEQYFKLHPEQPEGWIGMCRLHLLNGRVDEARTLYLREWKGYSEFSFAAQMAAQVEFFGRNFTEAAKLYRQLHARDAAGGGFFYGTVTYSSALGRIVHDNDPAAGRALLEAARSEEMKSLSRSVEDSSTRYRLAAIEASLGNSAEALGYLRSARELGWIDYRSMALDPRFDAIRETPEFKTIVAMMKDRVSDLRMAASGEKQLD